MQKRNVEAIYPLSSQQSSMLLQSLDPSHPDLAQVQVRCHLKGDLNFEVFQKAWRELVSRHECLRSSIHWQDLSQPVQVVHKEVEWAWDYQPAPGQSLKNGPLKLDRAPVARTALVKLGPDLHQLEWTCHHLLLDGWSAPLALQELLEIYDRQSSSERPSKSPTGSYGQYVRWRQSRSEEEAQRYWRELFADFEPSRRLASPGVTRQVSGLTKLDQLRPTLKEWGVTPATLLVGAWSLVAARLLGRDDLTVCVAVSGRGAGLPGIESIVGPLSNVIPMRIRLDQNQAPAEWLRDLQLQSATSQRYEDTSLAHIQEWVGRRLTGNLVAVQNFSLGSLRGKKLKIEDYESDFSTGFPLNLVVRPDAGGWELRLIYREQLLSEVGARQALEALLEVVDAIPRAESVSQLLGAHIELSRTDCPGGGSVKSPRNATETRLAELWARLLQVRVGVEDDFFDLGGDSLLALQMMAQVKQLFEKQIPLATLIERRTIRHLAEAIDDGVSPRWECLVPIKSGSRPPLYCVHGQGGHVLFCDRIARYLGPEQPLYGIQVMGAEGGPTHETCEELARHYLKEVRDLQPQGPYYLTGHCMGNLIAFEMAQQLLDEGEEIGLLAIVETHIPRPKLPLRRFLSWENLTILLEAFLVAVRREWKSNLARLFRRTQVPMGLRGEFPKILQRAYCSFRATRYSGKLYYLCADDLRGTRFKRREIERWNALAADGLELIWLGVNKSGLYEEPTVRVLAEQLEELVAQNS